MTSSSASLPRPLSARVTDLLVLAICAVIMLAAAYFRTTGLMWGEDQYLHPDERFLVWVGSDISPVKSLAEYFDTANSSLNPNNRGHGFYVYGTLPMFMARYAVEWIFGHTGWTEMLQVGRSLSTLIDLMAVFLVYLTAARLYDRRVGLLAMAFAAAAVLQIQQSHFFTMDNFAAAFSFLALYFAVVIATQNRPRRDSMQGEDWENTEEEELQSRRQGDPLLLPSLGFGVALGLAVASKINAAPMAIALPIAMIIYLVRLPTWERESRLFRLIAYLTLAGLLSLLVFRLLQPYAFSGPGFFGIKLNPQWVENIREQRAQASPDADFPPNMQWARRPIWFSFQNMVIWGLGLPLGILSWAGFLWAGWRGLHWRKTGQEEALTHALIWIWTAAYFTWQSLQHNPTMRYELPIYPTLVIFAAWAVVALYDKGKKTVTTEVITTIQGPTKDDDTTKGKRGAILRRLAAVIVGAVVLLLTYAYAYGFTQIYVRPITRIAASRWLYQNVPGPITLPIQNEEGVQNQYVPVPYDVRITPDLPFITSFIPRTAGSLSDVFLPRVKEDYGTHQPVTLTVELAASQDIHTTLATGQVTDDLSANDDPRGKSYTLRLDRPLQLDPTQAYRLSVTVSDPPITTLASQVIAYFDPVESNTAITQSLGAITTALPAHSPPRLDFTPTADGTLTHLRLLSSGGEAMPQPDITSLSLVTTGRDEGYSRSGVMVMEDPQNPGWLVVLQEPILVFENQTYTLSLNISSKQGGVSLSGLGIANEGDWDDGLPLRMDGYDGFGGIYPTDMGFNMYWDDNPEKLDRFSRILDMADYVVISSNRQWGSLPRLPERFPLTTIYYRNLLGCPPEMDVVYCYRVARPGLFTGNLGYELVQTFTSEPSIGPLRLNDQFAEEAFSVYDHPKVLIFKKTAGYDSQKVRAILGTTDFNQVVRIPPLRAKSHPANLMLPSDRFAVQEEGGTWSQLFDVNALINRFPALGALIWYLSVALLGIIVYPLLRLALPGLDDHGYPLARTAGLLLLSYLTWLAGSWRIHFTPLTIGVILLLMTLLATSLVYMQRGEMAQELRQKRRYFLIVEGLSLALFLAFLLIRWGNPDLWHPWKGGEKPMDFSYFNAVLKSTTFPPYDPWYAGGYLNYYYYGFVLVGTLVKFLGIVPSIAYNLIIPTLFSLIALGAFSVAWNLVQRADARRDWTGSTTGMKDEEPLSPYIPAVAAALGMAVLGNLGTVRMFYQGFQRLAAPGGVIEDAGLIQRMVWALRGFFEVLGGEKLPFSVGDWYWIPSRAIPAPNDVEPITEFPFFTALYADLHAHLLALPITLLVLACLVAIVLGQAHWKKGWNAALWFVLSALAIGALRPTNTWDMPLYLVLGLIATGYALYTHPPGWAKRLLPALDHPRLMRRLQIAQQNLRNLSVAPPQYSTDLEKQELWSAQEARRNPDQEGSRPSSLTGARGFIRRGLVALGGMILLGALAFLLYQPYAQWYALGYTKIGLWEGTHTPSASYLVHWGLFLFCIVAWMIWEARDWMAKTPVSALRRLAPYRITLLFLLVLLIFAILGLVFARKAYIAWMVLPLAVWAGILLLRPKQPDAKRIVLFMVGTGLMFTLMVEVIVLKGDIGRMNTVFKFYLQAWTLFSISAAAALGWSLPALPDWKPAWRVIWQVILLALIGGAFMYTAMATLAKIDDRMAEAAPPSLDGMAYMPYATYTDTWGPMDLGQDYRAIRWMQENVQGSPVIVEANLRDLYRWGSRFSIYTGLPGVVGWEWHQQQQRAVVPSSWVSQRIDEIEHFYTTTDLQLSLDFLRKYNVRYIIVGQQERGKYPGPGLDKFEDLDGLYWREVYREQDTVIYEVTNVGIR
jgi:YYY domain-containing protein